MGQACHWVRLATGDDVVGTGFFITPNLILTAGHCVDELSADISVELSCTATPTKGRLEERAENVDLALIKLDGSAGWAHQAHVPDIDYCVDGDDWESPARPADDDAHLTGSVIKASTTYRCQESASLEALELRTDVMLGGYHGYSGSPVERRRRGEQNKLVGLLIEQYPDRADDSRASNVLFAATVAETLRQFPMLSTETLLNRLSDRPADHVTRPKPTEERTRDALEMVNDFLADGLIGMPEATILRLQVASRYIWEHMTGAD